MAKYYLDTDLLFKRVKLTIKQKFIRFLIILGVSLLFFGAYTYIVNHVKESPKEIAFKKEIEELHLDLFLLDKQITSAINTFDNLEKSNDTYREILELGFVEHYPLVIKEEEYEFLDDLSDTELYIKLYKKLDTLSHLINKYEKSFYQIEQETNNWLHKIEHLPYITPVNVSIRRGEGIGFREVHPVLGYPTWHHGQDFRAPMGTPVYAPGAGKVIYVGYDRGFGNFVKIDHGYGFQTIYGHLSEFKVKRNQEVKRGDLIALTGNTGYSTGPHLHYEIHLYGKYQNPLHFFSDNMDEDEYLEMINTLDEIFKK